MRTTSSRRRARAARSRRWPSAASPRPACRACRSTDTLRALAELAARLAPALRPAADRGDRQQRQDHRHADDRVDPARLARRRRARDRAATSTTTSACRSRCCACARTRRRAPRRGGRARHEPPGRDRRCSPRSPRPTVALVNNAQREHQEFMASVEAVARENGAAIEALGASRRGRVPGRRRACARSGASSPAAAPQLDVRARSGARRRDRRRRLGRRPLGARCCARRPARRSTCAARGRAAQRQERARGHGVRAGRRRPLDAIARGLEAFEPVKGRSQAKASRARPGDRHAGRRHLQRQPRFGARRDRRAAGAAGAALARARRHGRGRRPGRRRSMPRSAPMRGSAASRRFWTAGRLCTARGRRLRAARAISTTSRACSPRCAQAPGLRRGARQGLALHEDGTVVAALLAVRRSAACCLAWPSGCRRSRPKFGFLRVFQYLTFRAVMAAMTALLIGLAFGPWVIKRLTTLKIGQPIREYGVADAPGQERHADDGRRADPDRHRRLDAALVRLEQPLRLDRDARDVRLRRDRLGRRLAQGRAEEPRRHAVAREVLLAVGDRPGRGAVPRVQRLRDLEPARAASSSCAGCRAASRTTCRRRPT